MSTHCAEYKGLEIGPGEAADQAAKTERGRSKVGRIHRRRSSPALSSVQRSRRERSNGSLLTICISKTKNYDREWEGLHEILYQHPGCR